MPWNIALVLQEFLEQKEAMDYWSVLVVWGNKALQNLLRTLTLASNEKA